MLRDLTFAGDCRRVIQSLDIYANRTWAGNNQAIYAGRHPDEPLRGRSLNPNYLVAEKRGPSFTTRQPSCGG